MHLTTLKISTLLTLYKIIFNVNYLLEMFQLVQHVNGTNVQ